MATAALAVAVGCGSDSESGSSGGGSEVKAPEGPKAPTELGQTEGQVNLIAWAGYVEDGSTDPKVDWQMYGVPHGRGANLLMWRSDKVKGDLDSWGAVFDKAPDNTGKVTAYD